MAKIDVELVKDLRRRTSAGIVECRKALEKAEGDIEKAIKILREKGIAKAEKKSKRETAEGIVVSYIHSGGRIGSLVELDCETDFVARTDEFKNLAREIAMQVAAMSPKYIDKENVPKEVIEREREILTNEAKTEGKPEAIIGRIVDGKISKFFSENCLLEQPWIKDDKKTVAELIKENISKLGENIKIKNFCRFEVGR